MVWGTAVWAVRDGPAGPRVSRYLPIRSLFLYANYHPRPSATTVVSSTNETRLPPNGRKIYIVMISLLVGRRCSHGRRTTFFSCIHYRFFSYDSFLLSNTFKQVGAFRWFSFILFLFSASSFLFKASSLCLSLLHSTTYYLFSISLANALFPVHLFSAYLVNQCVCMSELSFSSK